MSIVYHQWWPAILPCLYYQIDSKTRGASRERPRIEIKKDTPDAMKAWLRSFQTQCPACHDPYHPFRARAARPVSNARGRKQAEHLYFASACPPSVRGCCKGKEASVEYDRVKASLDAYTQWLKTQTAP